MVDALSPESDKEAVGRRLREFRKHLKLSQDAFAATLDVSKRGIQDNESGSNMPSGELLRALHRQGLNLGWLLEGEGEMLSSDRADVGSSSLNRDRRYAGRAIATEATTGDGKPAQHRAEQDIDVSEYAFIPYYDVRASAGFGAFVQGGEATRSLAFDRKWLAAQVGVSCHRLALIPVVGRSMEPDIHDGEIVMIDRGDIERLSEGAYVFELDDGLFVKRLSLRGDRLVIESSNADYPPIEVSTLRDQPHFKLHGRVLGSPMFKKV